MEIDKKLDNKKQNEIPKNIKDLNDKTFFINNL